MSGPILIKPGLRAITKLPPFLTRPPFVMMDVKISIDSATRLKMERIIAEFAETTGKTAEEGVLRMAKSSCRRLATTVQPYGLSGGKLTKFMKSIAGQVSSAWFGTNVGAYPETRSMQEAHRNARTTPTKGVPFRRFRKEKGKPWLGLIPETARDAQIKKMQARAFRAKAAWVKVANDLGGAKMSGVSTLISRHVSTALGSVSVTGSGMSTRVTISNNVPYVGKIQSAADVAKAQTDGMKNGLKYMETTTRKAIEKANRNL